MTKAFRIRSKSPKRILLLFAAVLLILLTAGFVPAAVNGSAKASGGTDPREDTDGSSVFKDLFDLIMDRLHEFSGQSSGDSPAVNDGEPAITDQLKLLSLRMELSPMIESLSGEWSVYVKDLNTGGILIINDTPMYPASTIKAFAMAYAYHQISRGTLEKTADVTKLLTRMITESDNSSFNQLVSLFGGGDFLKGAEKLNIYLKRNGYTETSVHHTLHPASNAYVTDGERNVSSVKDCGLLLERIENGSCVNRAASREMKNLLLDQKRTWKIPASLPPEAVVANKTGETSEVQDDIAIVSGPETSYVLCVFSVTTQSSGINGIKDISKAVWDQLEE